MNILGIETSCDETAAAVVVDGVVAKSNCVVSSLKDHQNFGGIIPEIASRRQMESISLIVRQALLDAHMTISDIDQVAVTVKPGLLGSLLVGIAYAQGLARAAEKPLINVNHVAAHLYANFVSLNGGQVPDLGVLPAIGLVVSGGHTSLYDIKNIKKMRLIGQTHDDAAGEAFDKVARLLALGYPGGPIIDRLAQQTGRSSFKFPQAKLRSPYDFSFSGLKTAVLYYTQKNQQSATFSVGEVAYAFQESVISSLVDKAIGACLRKKYKTLLVGGGVSSNSALRERLKTKGAEHGIDVYCPAMPLCLDNAAMIAGLAYHVGS